jgi:quinol monooxygenase YgiN
MLFKGLLMSDPITADRRALLLAGIASAGLGLMLTASAANAETESGLTVIAEIIAKPENAAEVRAALEPFAARTKNQAGCLHYALYEDAEAPGRFFTFERWTDEAALNAHLTSPAMREAGPKFAPMMAAPLAIHKLQSLVP